VKRHEADAVSLVFGLIFVGLAAGWALVRANLVDVADLQFAGPILLVVAGLIGLVVSLRRGRQAPGTWQDEPRADSDEPAEDTVVLHQPETVTDRWNGTLTDRDQTQDRPPTS
jgi:hypothetical protein